MQALACCSVAKPWGKGRVRRDRERRHCDWYVIVTDDDVIIVSIAIIADTMTNMYGVTRHTSHVTRHTSHVTRHTSHVTRHTSHVARHTSHVTRHTLTHLPLHARTHCAQITGLFDLRHTCHMSRVTCQTKGITCQTKGITCQTKGITCHDKHIKHQAPRQPRVCIIVQ